MGTPKRDLLGFVFGYFLAAFSLFLAIQGISFTVSIYALRLKNDLPLDWSDFVVPTLYIVATIAVIIYLIRLANKAYSGK